MPELRQGNTIAEITVRGAWVRKLVDNGQDILFPFSELPNEAGEAKKRGGMHVCLPNFGPGGDSGLTQHGFGRELEWTVTESNPASLRLVLENCPSGYESMRCELAYELGESNLEATLTLSNDGHKPLRVAPGFHPYFALEPDELEVSVNGVTYRLDQLAGTEFITANQAVLVTASHSIELQQQGLTTWAIWTDQLGDYVCVEPTFGGNRFLEEAAPAEHLVTGQSRSFYIRISW